MTDYSIAQVARLAKIASHQVATLNSGAKNKVLHRVAQLIREHTAIIISENKKDLVQAEHMNLSTAMVDRLVLNESRLEDIAQAVEDIAAQQDPVGSISQQVVRPNGIQVGKMRIPLGVVAMVYESRPNVTIDAAALCFKAGNVVILRGGKEALNSNIALAECFRLALIEQEISDYAVNLIPTADRSIMAELLKLSDDIDLVIPRGGEGLIRYVTDNSRIPVIQHFKGVCHLYVDQSADLNMALDILLNGKVQRPGVCNALETLLVHQREASKFLPLVAKSFKQHNVIVHACKDSLPYFDYATPATAEDWDKEYLDLEIAIKVVADFEEGIAHIQRHSSGHTEVIVTDNLQRSREFTQRLNSAVIMVNASSRFSDGGQLGLGAEIGISTSKLHAYGPMGVESLTTEKFVVVGSGQVRN